MVWQDHFQSPLLFPISNGLDHFHRCKNILAAIMKTLLYEVTLRNPTTKAAYPEEFVGLRSIAGVTPGGHFYIEVTVHFPSIPLKDGMSAQTVEIEVTVNGQDIGWVFDVNPAIPTCTFSGFPQPNGSIVPFSLAANVPNLVPDDETDNINSTSSGNPIKVHKKADDDNEWLEELFSVQIHATVIYAYVNNGYQDEDPIPSDYFEFPVHTLYYHTPGSVQSLKANYEQQNRSSAAALDVALTTAITAADYEDFYADNYDPNDDSDDDDNNNDVIEIQDSDDDSEDDESWGQGKQPAQIQNHNTSSSNNSSDVQIVGYTKQQKKAVPNTLPPSVRNEDDEDEDEDDDWWGTTAQPQASLAIQQQKQRHQSNNNTKTNAATTNATHSNAATNNNTSSSSSSSSNKRPFEAVTSAAVSAAPPAKRPTTTINATNNHTASTTTKANNNNNRSSNNVTASLSAINAAVTVAAMANQQFAFALTLAMDSSDSEGD